MRQQKNVAPPLVAFKSARRNVIFEF